MLNINDSYSTWPIKTLTTVVADSSDLDAIRKFRPLDATTNPSLITAAAEQPESKELIEDAYYQAKEEGYSNDELIERTIDILTVKFGVEILKLIEGRVSTEVDAALSYDTEATIKKRMNYVNFTKVMVLISHVFLLKLHRLGKVFKLPKCSKLKELLVTSLSFSVYIKPKRVQMQKWL